MSAGNKTKSFTITVACAGATSQIATFALKVNSDGTAYSITKTVDWARVPAV